MIDLNKLEAAKLQKEPFPFFACEGLLGQNDIEAVARDFPIIKHPGVFPLSELNYGKAFERLIEEVRSRDLEQVLSHKFGIDLSRLPLMITVRGMCQRKDGQVHTDSKDKVVTCLLYLNPGEWNEEGGRLRLLRNEKDLDDVITEVSPKGGNFVAFKRTDNAWHGHASFEGPRRYIMFNWVRSDLALNKNILRHKLSATMKKLGLRGGGYAS